ncbi:PspA-associated protein PspAA [Nocardioides aequoreus]|uniref:PspA-associated protein PspAA n=1 Tax=Nocardioides aequoreus TaxID=397278 RepID=UPI0004C3E450|nr:hypothetical protein [Nocardioides aequoreus]
MIVRIMGEGQLEVSDDEVSALNGLDDAVEQAVEAGDHEVFAEALGTLLTRVRELGRPVGEDFLHDSDLILPPPDATLEEVRALLGDDGLIPG